MRETLFRGKRKDNGEWAYGYYGEFHNRPLVNEANICQIFEPHENASKLFNSMIGGIWRTVDKETVGQWTGLVDINGKKIFEDDIVKDRKKYGGDETYKVCFGEHTVECCGCCYDCHKIIGFYLDGYKDDEETWDDLEVVGDIYQPKVEITVPTNTGKQTKVVEPWEVEMLKARALVSEDYSKLGERFYQPIKGGKC